jgi:cell division protein FtsQ
LGLKRHRKNYYKNSSAKRKAYRLQRLRVCWRLTAVGLGAAALSIVFVFCYSLLTQSTFFKASDVVVEGPQRLTTQAVLDQAHLRVGMNIFAVNLTTTRKRLLAHPWIASAEVGREIPSGIQVRIEEHEPLAILDLGRKFVLNAEGRIFKEWHPSDPGDLPLVTGLDYADIDPHGQASSAAYKSILRVLKLGRQPASVLPNERIQRIDVDREIGITVYAFEKAQAIKLGFKDYPTKYGRLKHVLGYLKARPHTADFDSIDLVNLDRIVINPVKSKPSGTDHKEV